MKKDKVNKIDELMAHIFYIETILTTFLGIKPTDADKDLERLRKIIRQNQIKED